jgi:hypothetical protein
MPGFFFFGFRYACLPEAGAMPYALCDSGR